MLPPPRGSLTLTPYIGGSLGTRLTTPIGHGKIHGPLSHAPHQPEELCVALLDATQHLEEPSTMDSLDLLKALSGTLLIGINYSRGVGNTQFPCTRFRDLIVIS